jgi:hypothetical protein
MSIDNQIEPPQSFMAMYITPGRDRPNAPPLVLYGVENAILAPGYQNPA